MRYSSDSILAIKGPLGGCSLEDWPSFLENSPGEAMPRPSPASLLARIERFSRTPHGLAVISILWVLFVFALVFASTRLTSWEMPARAFIANSTAALPLENDSDGWMARRLYCSPSQPCDVWSLYSEERPFNLRYEILYDDPAWLNQTA